MKLFGEFLVEKGLVKEEDLLACLIDQVASLPSLCEIAYRLKLIPPSQFLQALSYQALHQVEFKRACEELGFWTSSINNIVDKELQRQRMPIGQVLVKRGIVKFEVLTAALEEYLATLKPSDAVPTPDHKAPVIPLSQKTHGPAVSVLHFEPHFYFVEHEVLVDYLEQLADGKRSEMEECLTSTADLDSALHNLYQHYQAVRGSARFIKADLTEHLIQKMLEVILVAQRVTDHMTKAQKDDLIQVNRQVLDLVWELKNSLEFSGSEGTLWKNTDFQKKFLHVFQQMEKSRSTLHPMRKIA